MEVQYSFRGHYCVVGASSSCGVCGSKAAGFKAVRCAGGISFGPSSHSQKHVKHVKHLTRTNTCYFGHILRSIPLRTPPRNLRLPVNSVNHAQPTPRTFLLLLAGEATAHAHHHISALYSTRCTCSTLHQSAISFSACAAKSACLKRRVNNTALFMFPRITNFICNHSNLPIFPKPFRPALPLCVARDSSTIILLYGIL